MASKLRWLPETRLLRGTEGTQAFPGWVVDPDWKPPRDVQSDHMEALLDTLGNYPQTFPLDVIGIEVGARQLACYWLEGPDSSVAQVVGISTELQRLSEDLRRVEERLEADYLDPNS